MWIKWLLFHSNCPLIHNIYKSQITPVRRPSVFVHPCLTGPTMSSPAKSNFAFSLVCQCPVQQFQSPPFNKCVLPVVTYANESRTVYHQRRGEKKLDACEHRWLKKLKISYRDGITNDEVRQKTQHIVWATEYEKTIKVAWTYATHEGWTNHQKSLSVAGKWKKIKRKAIEEMDGLR